MREVGGAFRHRRVVTAVVGVAAFALACTARAQPAGDCAAGFPGGSRAASANHIVAWRADPQKIPVGKHFALDLLVCAKAGSAPVPPLVAVDARMPSHGHGMNYKPTLKAVGENRYRAEGLMFHMPGQWTLLFDLRAGDKAEQAAQAVTVR